MKRKQDLAQCEVRLENVWLVFNWGTFFGWYSRRRDAMEDIEKALGPDCKHWKKYFDIRRGDVHVQSKLPFRTWPKRRSKGGVA